ncbi:MAG TPA: AAA family ATPase [Actinomycetes bacterium]|nr:AAA family ATPase [Actinomycetes bacterium]
MSTVATCPSCGTEVPPLANFCLRCGERLTPIPVEGEIGELKVVTVVFCDVARSTELSQRLELVTYERTMGRFAETARLVLARYGGKVGKRQGDSVMAVFGIPVTHDDDALRAVRAALELQETLRALDEELEGEYGVHFHVRVGVNTGRVLVHDRDSVEEQVTGPAVIVARRLEEGGEPGGVLIGEETHQLVRDAVRTQQVEALQLQGVAEPVAAFRLLEVLPGKQGRIPRLRDAPMLGREREQELLGCLFNRVVAERSCHLVTLHGYAGVGKTRLADEFSRGLAEQARLLRGHCLAYGDAVTFWPVVQIVNEAARIEPTDKPETARKRLEALFGTDERDRQALSHIGQLLGISEPSDLPGDTAGALRRLLESIARRQPLVVLVEDLQWAEPILLDVLEDVADKSRDAPIMLLCMARPGELFHHRPDWPGGKLNATSILLSPLDDHNGEQLVSHLLGEREFDPDALAHITYLARGYPLIVQELVATLIDRGVLRQLDGRWIATADLTSVAMPPRIDALLSARLDRLDLTDRRIIERAAVVGERFHFGDIEALSPASTPVQVAARLDALVRQELVYPDHSAAAPLVTESGEGYRFRHIMIRSVVYERITEPHRAELHERFADHLERTAGERLSQFDEMIGYHLNEAYQYLRKLGPLDEHIRLLARRAGERYAAAGQRAALRGDIPLTCSWLERASRLLPADHPTRLAILPDLAYALQSAGELSRALRVYEEILEAARPAGDERIAVHAELGRLYVTAFGDLESFLRGGRERIERSLPLLERLEDHLGLGKAWYLLAYLDWAIGHSETAREEVERALGLIRLAHSDSWEASAARLHCLILYWGPAPLPEVERHAREALELAQRSGIRSLEASALTIQARIEAMQGDFDAARRFTRQANDITTDLGELLTQATDSISEGTIELLAGDLRAADLALRSGRRALEKMGGTGPLASLEALLARVLLRQERHDEAEHLTQECEAVAASHQIDAQVKWRSIRAMVYARRGALEAAERLAREAVNRADGTDQLEIQAEARADLGEVLRLAGRREEAVTQLNRALQLYERKGNVTAAKQVRMMELQLRR